jgi:hypothetical protein
MCFQMSRVSPEMRNFARRLIICEANGNKSARIKPPAAFDVCEKLRPVLATLMGNGGFRALLARARALAAAEVPWLRAVHVRQDGTLAGLDELAAQPDPDTLLEGRVVLLAWLLELLVAFIGADLTLRLVREVWPREPLMDVNLANKGKHEKTK